MKDFPAVRRARREDLERIADLWKAFLEEQTALDERLQMADDALERFRNDFPVWLSDETQRVFVAEQEDKVLGFATAHRSGPPPIYAEVSEVYIDELYVAREVRGKGLGRQLAAAIRHWAEKLRADRLRLTMLAANDDARTFWEGQGARSFSQTFTIELTSDPREEGEESKRSFGFE